MDGIEPKKRRAHFGKIIAIPSQLKGEQKEESGGFDIQARPQILLKKAAKNLSPSKDWPGLRGAQNA